jgi:hypothetical protein
VNLKKWELGLAAIESHFVEPVMENGTRRMENKVTPSYFIQRRDEIHPPEKRMRLLRKKHPFQPKG